MTTVADAVDTAETIAPAAAAVRTHRTRADALRNRERIVAAARGIFVEYGPDAPLDEIARRAGIGNATLYRHFPDRDALVHAVLLSVVTRTADRAETEAALAAAGGDPCAALGRFAHAAVDDNVGALCGLLVNGDDSHSAEIAVQAARLETALDELMDRARRDGRLRLDVTLNDLMVAISRLTRPLPGVDCTGSDLHRHLQLFLDGLKTPYPDPTP
ncbi:TetR/AcrR family transcriptional regulator [Actinacidiphila paucisporea]|uniref:Transcriptional regulator, TetR family n=1 Tax=Actinacidiphila paucisporea TaxID=310782 RepID=A0A1M6Z5M7_9ACTN|nr:transcriptional regulator, TetR family [Actinacidiphila paucisporea]